MQKIICTVVFAAFLLPLQAEARGSRSAPKPTIVSRAEWGADESWGITTEAASTNGGKTALELQHNTTRALTQKEKKCRDVARTHAHDFATHTAVHENEFGQPLRWKRRYDEKKVIVIHHTGEHRNSEAENLSGAERIRAVYKGHTLGNGWGDIGYHYIIDKKGVIYEGRAGGKGVVGAHVYCANVGTLGVALAGNFQIAYPTEGQLRSLRQLIAWLGDEYNIDINGRTVFQGRSMPTVVSHRDLAPTQCAGRKTQKLLPKIRRLAAAGDFSSAMLTSETRFARSRAFSRTTTNSLKPRGSKTLKMNPRGTATVELIYRAGARTVKAGEAIGDVYRSDNSIGIWQRRFGSRIRVRRDIRAERDLRIGDEATVRLTVLGPRRSGIYTINIGGLTYLLEVEGRRKR